MRTELETTGRLAVVQAEAAAERAQVAVRTLEELDDFTAASRVFESVWGTGPANSQMPPEFIRALTHAGSYAAGAFHDGQMIGAIVGFLGREHNGDASLVYVHSHILGVLPSAQTRHVGFALKQHQRAWALERKISLVTWTFDPLVRRNAYFNVQKLGAEVAGYYPNFYGPMTDGINAGDDTDRIFVAWRLDSRRVAEAADGGLSDPDVDALVEAGAVVALSNDGGSPTSGRSDGDTVLCAVPGDIVELRSRDRALGREWRIALRDTLGTLVRDGYAVTGFARSGWYVLERR